WLLAFELDHFASLFYEKKGGTGWKSSHLIFLNRIQGKDELFLRLGQAINESRHPPPPNRNVTSIT
ncbi:unnamed protein product, partial [Musa acuminata var. zebrina]